MTIEQIDAHLEQHSKDLTSVHGVHPENAGKIDICKYYLVVAPILRFIIPIVAMIKPKWAEAVKPFLEVMDSNCKTK